MMAEEPGAVRIVVPVRDEEERLAACLEHLRAAMDRLREDRPHLAVRLTVVCDRCTDSSGALALSFAAADPRIEVMSVDFGSVGASRAAGVARALAAGSRGPVSMQGTWIASTDADTRVPVHWLTRMVALAEAGADAVAGTVEPDRAELGEARYAQWKRRHSRREGHGHVHGANLGVRASAYLDAGGFDPVALHEDVRLVEKLRRNGARIVATGQIHAVTSGRVTGRVDAGFAGYLRRLGARAAVPARGANR